MSYRIILDKNVSLKDKKTHREVMIKENCLSIAISEPTLKYIKENYCNNIIEIQEVKKIDIVSTTKASNILQQTSNSKKDIVIEIIDDASIDDPIEKEDFLSDMDDFNISDTEIDNLINLEDDMDRIFINHDDGKENIVEEKVEPKKITSSKKTIQPKKKDMKTPHKKKKVNKKIVTKKITLNKKQAVKEEPKKNDIVESLDIDAVLDFFAEDDPYEPDTESMANMLKK